MTGPEPVLSIRDLSFRYPETLSGRSVTALRHVSLAVNAGEFTLITGPSGSGKSTLARCVNSLIPHSTKGTMEGNVAVCGMDTRDHDPAEFAPLVGMVFQDPGYQIVTGDVESEIAFGLEVQNLPEEEIQTRIDETASLLHIRHLVGRRTGDLSWGERQRVAIASVLVLRPSLLVMDEPLSGIDASARHDLAALLAELKASAGTTIIIFEHRTTSLIPIADRLVVMKDGAVISDGAVYIGTPLPCNRSPAQTTDIVCTMDVPSVKGKRGTPVSAGSRMPGPSLSIRNLHYHYPGSHTDALDGITLDLYPGELTVITGPNGAGKTTLLKHCNGLLSPDRGSVYVGKEPLALKTVAVAARSVGLLNQHADYQLFESTIGDELAFGPRNLGKSEDETAAAIQKILKECSLDHIDPSTPPLGLSGGEKQRVAIGGILAMDTPVLILDEPTFGLDPGLKRKFGRFLRDLCRAGKTVIVATHDNEFAAEHGDRFIAISAGHIESDSRKVPGQGNTPPRPGEYTTPGEAGHSGGP